MTDDQLLRFACVRIVLEADRGLDGTLTIACDSYDGFPEILTVGG